MLVLRNGLLNLCSLQGGLVWSALFSFLFLPQKTKEAGRTLGALGVNKPRAPWHGANRCKRLLGQVAALLLSGSPIGQGELRLPRPRSIRSVPFLSFPTSCLLAPSRVQVQLGLQVVVGGSAPTRGGKASGSTSCQGFPVAGLRPVATAPATLVISWCVFHRRWFRKGQIDSTARARLLRRWYASLVTNKPL